MRGNSHVNGIESFWSYAKSRLHQFHGVAPEKFYLHLKECEYRFNLRKNNVYAELLKLLRKSRFSYSSPTQVASCAPSVPESRPGR